ncbi:hypothetical protein F3J44_21920 [Pantoea sp. Tr-811]|uniref:hypothetical protein n=1 Tax=unclassified Pantoea TaxID=2630326 RepID=UPI0014209080|nr:MULTISPECIES: hypothetical protein [unclassified Pantoea]NIE73674.1 hypothetical protein [Pantoea sp. Ap-967]NIF29028.1 hypothetical protein [Pantoea sp. Tr-811]
MANNQDKGAHQGGTTKPDMGKTGQQGGHGAGGDMGGKHQGGQKSGQMPDDKMNKDWDATKDTGRQGGQSATHDRDTKTADKAGAMGGQHARDDQQRKDKDR